MRNINRLSFLIGAAVMSAAHSYRMADDMPAAVAQAPEVPPAPVAVAVQVPAEHADLIQRAVELLKRGEQFVVDNIHAGLTALEGLFKDDEDADDLTPPEDAPPAA